MSVKPQLKLWKVLSMALTNAGAIALAAWAIGDVSVPLLNGSNAHLGVGDSSTVFAASQTDLQAASNKLRKGMESGYPTRSSGALTLRSLFGTSEANFVWAEWASFNGSSGNTMFTRKVEALGTKTNTQSWQLTSTITLAAA
jgi:hypothetical protein